MSVNSLAGLAAVSIPPIHSRGWGTGFWVMGIIMLVALGILLVMVTYMLVRTISQNRGSAHAADAEPDSPDVTDSNLDIARRRYASGEITKEQLAEIESTLKGT